MAEPTEPDLVTMEEVEAARALRRVRMSPETEQKLLAMVSQCIETRIAAGLPVDEASWPDWLFPTKPRSKHEPLPPAMIAAIKAQRDADLKRRETCQHQRWSFEKYGRCCPDCGTFCVDFGD